MQNPRTWYLSVPHPVVLRPIDHYHWIPLFIPFHLITHSLILIKTPATWTLPRFPSTSAPADLSYWTPLFIPFHLITHSPILLKTPATWTFLRFPYVSHTLLHFYLASLIPLLHFYPCFPGMLQFHFLSFLWQVTLTWPICPQYFSYNFRLKNFGVFEFCVKHIYLSNLNFDFGFFPTYIYLF